MEKKEDASSPIGVLEDFFKTEEFETSSSSSYSSSKADSSHEQSPKHSSLWRGINKLFRTKSKKDGPNPFPLSAFRLSLRRSSSLRENVPVPVPVPAYFFVTANSQTLKKSPRNTFSLSELQNATNNFTPDNLIGKGGYAEVFKGRLQNGQLVAIKRLMKGTPDEIIGDFLTELGIMAHVNHTNTAKLIGYGIEGGMHLVLELSHNGSLASLLYGSKERLNWGVRYKIALGTAEGLLYLHEGCKKRIIHRDIKAANILLTEDFEPQICDFGLAKWLPEHWTHITVSRFEGTFGYLAPEYLMHGIVDEKTDVFAFGVLLLELVTGRRALDYSQQSLVLWAKPLLKKNDIRELIDPALGDDFNSRQMNLVLLAAASCIHQTSIRRPQMSQVLQLLRGDSSSLRKCRIPMLRKVLRQELLNLDNAA